MKIKYCKYIIILSFLTSSLLFSHHALSKQINDKLAFSGFARLVLGYLDDSNATYLGYDNSLSLSEQSLIALQVDYQISNKLSVTSQVIGSTGDERDSGIEWLYLTYEPNRFSQIKIGRQRTPFFNYSDVIDVGFVYPWITLPQQVYSSVFFSTFDGILGSYEWGLGDTVLNFEAFWGEFDGDISTGGSDVSGKAENLRGVILNLTYDNFNFRSAYHRTTSVVEFNALSDFSNILAQAGFVDGAESLNPDGDIEFYQVGLAYESLDFFVRGEAISIQTESSVIPDADSFFISVGYNYFPYTTYISYAKANNDDDIPANFIPLGLNSRLDSLSVGYDFLVEEITSNDSESITLGTRWDWKATIALKAEVTWTRVEDDLIKDGDLGDDFTPLYQLALEWVF